MLHAQEYVVEGEFSVTTALSSAGCACSVGTTDSISFDSSVANSAVGLTGTAVLSSTASASFTVEDMDCVGCTRRQ